VTVFEQIDIVGALVLLVLWKIWWISGSEQRKLLIRLPHPQLGMERELSEKSILVLVQSYDEDEEGLRDFVSSASWCNRRFAPGKESQKNRVTEFDWHLQLEVVLIEFLEKSDGKCRLLVSWAKRREL